MRQITIANGYGAPQPKQRLVWVVGGNINTMIQDELGWFTSNNAGGRYFYAKDSAYLLIGEMWHEEFPESLRNLFRHLQESDSVSKNVNLLYSMLDEKEFEYLMANLIQKHPSAQDVTEEDYVLSLFIEHEKKRRKSYI